MHKNFLSNGLGGLIAIAFFVFPHESLYNKDFKPDNFMVLCLISGVYYLQWYMKNKKISNLCLSFILLFSSFMFTQKSVLELLCIGCLILYFIFRKNTICNAITI